MRVVNQLGERAAAAVLRDFPDAQIVDFIPDGPPPGFAADVMFGGWGGWDLIEPWVRTVPWVQRSNGHVEPARRKSGVNDAAAESVDLVIERQTSQPPLHQPLSNVGRIQEHQSATRIRIWRHVSGDLPSRY